MAAIRSEGIALGQLLPGKAGSAADVDVFGISQDSRTVEKGDLFLAVSGWQLDGRDYIPQAVANGCAAVVAEAEGFAERCPQQGTVVKTLEKNGVPLILVAGLQPQVSEIAANYYGHPGQAMKILGVTGTNGKTTCTSLLAQMASLLGETAGVVGTLGWGKVDNRIFNLTDTGMTTPDAIHLQEILSSLHFAGVTTLAMEVSSHSLDQGRIAATDIDCAIFTNLSRDHLDYHGTEEQYAAAKARLFNLPSVKQAVVNIDDNFGAQIFSRLPESLQAISYGLSPGADVRATDIRLAEHGLSFTLHSPWGEGVVETGLLGKFNVWNLLAVIAAFCLRGQALASVLSLVPGLQPVPGRMEMLSQPGSPVVIVDYAHTPDALEHALMSLRQHCSGTLWCVFGCGGDRDRGKRSLMGSIAATQADQVVVTSDNPRSENPANIIQDILAGIKDRCNVQVIEDRQAAIETVIASADSGDCILVAGKGHERYQQIGEVKYPFSDVAVAKQVLENRARDTGRRDD